MQSSIGSVSITGHLLTERIAQLARIGADPGGGVTRLAYSAEDVHARRLVADWMAAAGLEVWTDAATNLFGRLPGSDRHAPALLSGSHLDSVVRAGPLDGPAGVVTALTVAEALQQAGRQLRHDLVVVAFSNEEGARGTTGMAGSKAMAGRLSLADLAHVDAEGVTLSDRIRGAGGDPARIAEAAWPPERIAALIELHIEQGPVLESSGARIGVVNGVTGQVGVIASITGAANHPGTTPMSGRRDASVAAARLILAVQALADDGHVRVATTGTLSIGPGVRNVIPGTATVGIEIRDDVADRMESALAILDQRACEIAATTGTTITLRRGDLQPPIQMDSALAGYIADAADALGAKRLTMYSGAGHDAQIMAGIARAAMIFVPSINGVSHAPGEATAPEDLALGAEVLMRALLEADAQLM